MIKLTNALTIQEKGKFPFQPQPNLKGQFGLNEETLSESRFDEVKYITILRIRKVINKLGRKIEEEVTSKGVSEEEMKEKSKKTN